MLAFSNDYYGLIFRATQSVELFCAYLKTTVSTFTFHNVSINTYCSRSFPRRSYLFTFHNVSINTGSWDEVEHMYTVFTFHNVSINTVYKVSEVLRYPDDFSGEIYKEYCQVINKNDSEKHKNELMDSLNILDYKDADIIATQYQIDIKKVVSDLKEYHGYQEENINIVFEQIQKIAYEKIRKRSYERNYLEMLNEKYAKANFINIFDRKCKIIQRIVLP